MKYIASRRCLSSHDCIIDVFYVKLDSQGILFYFYVITSYKSELITESC